MFSPRWLLPGRFLLLLVWEDLYRNLLGLEPLTLLKLLVGMILFGQYKKTINRL